MADHTCDDLNHRDYIDSVVKGALICAIEVLQGSDASVYEEPLTDLLRLARDRLGEVLDARAAAPAEQEVRL